MKTAVRVRSVDGRMRRRIDRGRDVKVKNVILGYGEDGCGKND